MRPKKELPLIVAPSSRARVGGIGSWTKNMIAYLESEGRNSGCRIHTYSSHLRNSTGAQGLSRIVNGLILYSRLSLQVFFLIRKYRPSVLHMASSASIGLFKDVMVFWISRLMKTPFIIHWHFGRIRSLAGRRNWEWKLLRYLVHRSAAAIVIDSQSHETLRAAGYENVVYIPNPIAFHVEQESKKVLDTAGQRPQGRVLFVGHVVRGKGVFELVEACSEVPAIKELVLIGPYERKIKRELKQIASRREAGAWLNFIGQLAKHQVLEYMLTSPILALPSYTEGFPNVIIEAMAMGCAIVATDVGAIPDILDAQGTRPCGLCVPPRNTAKLKDAVLELLQDPSQTEMMGRRGMERVLRNYTIERIIEQYRAVWENALQP